MNRKGEISTGAVIVILAILVVAWQVGLFDGLLNKDGGNNENVLNNCPSSGLTELTLNTQEALASTATAAQVDVFVYDSDGNFYKTDNSGTDGQTVIDVSCGVDKSYTVLVVNETTGTGYYSQEFNFDANEPTVTKNLDMYEYGQVNLVSVASSTDPTGGTNIAAGAGKTCGFTVTFTENESVSAFNKPLIICDVNVTSVDRVYMDDNKVNDANSKAPSRLSPASGYTFYTFEYPKLVKSTDSAVKIDGTIKFLDAATPREGDDLTCRIVDQASYKKASYQTLSLDDGFELGAQNSESKADVGAPDSSASSLTFNATATSYC